MSIGDDEDGRPYEVPVYAPVDSRLTRLVFYVEHERGEPVDIEQYKLTFEVSCEVSYGFDHLSRLSEDLGALAPSEPARTTRGGDLPTSVPVSAGELIGYTTGTITAHNWDFPVRNTARVNEFANQERYALVCDLASLVAGDCPYEYYEGQMKAELYSLLAGFDDASEETGCFKLPDMREAGSQAAGSRRPFRPSRLFLAPTQAGPWPSAGRTTRCGSRASKLTFGFFPMRRPTSIREASRSTATSRVDPPGTST